MGSRTRRVRALGAVVLVAGTLAGCSGSGGGSGTTAPSTTTGTTTSSSTTSSSSSTSSSPSPTSTAPTSTRSTTPRTSPGRGWTSGPTVVVRDLAVPPVPQLEHVRAAAHTSEGFDRIVFDFDGRLPGYQIRYVPTVVEDASGKTVAMPGRRYLQVVLRPAQAHDEGEHAVTGRHDLGFPMLKGYVVAGDFEGVVTIALGLDDVVGYRVGELPGHLYIDVAA